MNEITTYSELKYQNKQKLISAYKNYFRLCAQVDEIINLVDDLYQVVQAYQMSDIVDALQNEVLYLDDILVGNSGGK